MGSGNNFNNNGGNAKVLSPSNNNPVKIVKKPIKLFKKEMYIPDDNLINNNNLSPDFKKFEEVNHEIEQFEKKENINKKPYSPIESSKKDSDEKNEEHKNKKISRNSSEIDNLMKDDLCCSEFFDQLKKCQVGKKIISPEYNIQNFVKDLDRKQSNMLNRHTLNEFLTEEKIDYNSKISSLMDNILHEYKGMLVEDKNKQIPVEINQINQNDHNYNGNKVEENE